MRTPKKAKLYATIRLVPDVDSIGVPVFSVLNTNAMFVPEMDSEFSISKFLDFYNEDGYQLDCDLPAAVNGKWYQVGEPCPISFWHKGACRTVDGDGTPETLAQLFGAEIQTSRVLADIARLLNDARTGRFARLKARWVAEDLASRFHEVFYETPVRSKYWVSRYRVAVATARKLSQPPHPIDVRLRRVGREWMRRFAAKTDLPRLQSMLGKPEDGIFAKKEAASIIYAFLVNKIATNGLNEISAEAGKPWFAQQFPYGLQGYSTSRDWRGAPFDFNEPRDFTELLVQEVVEGRYRGNFDRAERLAFILYGRMDAPVRVLEFAQPIHRERNAELGTMIEDSRSVFRDGLRSDEWQITAKTVLAMYNKLMHLDGVMHGQHRLSRDIINHRFGVSSYYIGELKKYAAGEI